MYKKIKCILSKKKRRKYETKFNFQDNSTGNLCFNSVLAICPFYHKLIIKTLPHKFIYFLILKDAT